MRHTPWHSLIFLALVFFLLADIGFIFPKEGIKLGDKLALNYPDIKTLFAKEEKTRKPDISKIIALADSVDAIQNTNTVSVRASTSDSGNTDTSTAGEIPVDTNIRLITVIQYKSASRSALHNFFNSLKNIGDEPKSIRVLHYGDSQIEGDRISDYLRTKLQAQFGGEGPGLVSLMPVAPSVINKISWSDGWDRYGIFASKDKRVPHNNFGVMAHFTRFCPFSTNDTVQRDKTAWVKVQTTRLGGGKSTAYSRIKLFYGGAKAPLVCEFYDSGLLRRTDSLEKGGNFHIKEYSVIPNSLNHEFKFKGMDSPDFYGVSLEGGKGVMVDNMGLRGSSGTFFNQSNSGQMKQFFDHLNVKLVILQFGGNTLPYIKDKTQAQNYAGYLKSQINTIKKLAPGASILVVGPADMSVKVGTEYETHPLLEDLRDAIRQTAFDTDCAFFDMYDCMGGKNSMVAWVEKGVAAKDYIHFSGGGARKIATLMYSSLINDYNAFLKTSKK